MEYKRVRPDRGLLLATSTEGVRAVVFSGKYEICMIAGVEDGKLICYAVFSHMPVSNRDVYLEYLYTVPEYRERGACTRLLEYCDEYLSGCGVSVILSRIFLRPKYAREYNSFITRRNYIPLCVTGRILDYRLEDMLGSGTIQTIIKAKKKLPEVVAPSLVGEKLINALLSDNKRTGFYFVKSECDEEVSRFFVENGEIHGAIIASRPTDDTLYISSIYMDNIAKKKNMFLALFCECIEPVLNKAREQDIKVIVMLNSENLYNGLMLVFNPPEEEFLVLEHMHLIGIQTA